MNHTGADRSTRGTGLCTVPGVLLQSEAIRRPALTIGRYLPNACRLGRSRSLALQVAVILALSGCASTGQHRGSTRERPQNVIQEMTHQHHTIDYIEFTVDDLAQAKRFYGTAFGWTFNDYGPEYAGIQRAGGGEVGGMRLDSSVKTGGPLVVLYSDDLEESVRAVREAGGQIVKEPFDFPGGRRFHFLDPAGNELAVASYH